MARQSGATLSNWLEKALSADMKETCKLLWTDENPFYDAVIKVPKQKDEPETSFNVHKLVLASRSGKFASQLYNEYPRDSSMTAFEIPFIIDVHNLLASTVALVLEFLYTDEIQGKFEMEWQEFGGLLYAAKQLEIPRLSEYCNEQFTCEKILAVFQQFTGLKQGDLKWPKHYYTELLTLCYSYILRNGEVILRAKTFVELSTENIESFISSDFLICAEITLYNNLKRWAKCRCKKQGMDSKQIQNLRSVLQLSSDDDDDSLGLLRHVRFPLMNSETFADIHKTSTSLIPNKFAERVYEYYAISEPTGIFTEKERHTEITNENLVAFNQHIEELIKRSLSQLYLTNDSYSMTTGSASLPSVSGADGENISQRVSQNAKNDANPGPEVNGSQLILKIDPNDMAHVSIKIERDPNDENVSNFGSSMQNSQPTLPVKKSPLSYNNQGHTVTIGEVKTEVIKNKSPVKRKGIKMTVENEGMSALKIKKIANGINSSDYTVNTCLSGTKKSSNGKIIRSNGLSSSVEPDVYTKRRQKLKYRNVIDECSKLPHTTKINLEDIEIEDVKKMKSFPSICLPKLTDFSVKASIVNIKKGNFIQNLMNVNLERYLFFYREKKSSESRLSDLWASSINAKLIFDGITLFEVRSPGLTMNYTEKSSFFALKSHILSNIKILNLGNCKIEKKDWLEGKYAQHLVELRLLCVNGLTCSHILPECESLETLSIWPVENQKSPSISLDDIKSEKLVHLSIQGHLIKFNPNSNREFVTLEELSLCDCSFDPSFIEEIPTRFPRLRKMFIISRFYSYDANLLSALMSMSRLEDICVWNFNAKSLNNEKFSELKELMKDLNFKTCSGELNFKIRREIGSRCGWKGRIATNKGLMKRIYESFGFEKLYTFDAWEQFFWSHRDYY